MAPGYFSADPFFACGPLALQEFNLDYRGNLTLCCQLSGYAGTNAGTDCMGNLHDISLMDACERFRQQVATYLATKQERVQRGVFSELDHFPCWYYVQSLGKVTWLHGFPEHPWASMPAATTARSNHDHLG